MAINFKRFLATLIDHVIILHAIAIIIFLFGNRDEEYTYSANSLCWVIICSLIFFYFPFCHFLFRRTLGKKILKLQIKFVSQNHTAFKALLLLVIRNIVAVLENLILFYMIPIALLSLNGKRLSDLASYTYVDSI
jgi:RDD family